ncbi:MAG: PfkB family carbohydrate kinase, partial [Acidimicrobiia bacterium]
TLLFGEALIDVYPDRRMVAGAPLHVAAHLAVLGWDARLVSRVGDDQDGREILKLLRERGAGTSLVEVDPELPTGTVTITFDDDGDHSFTIHRPVAWDAIAGPDDLPHHDVLCYGSLAGRDSRSRAALLRLLAASTAPLRVMDVNLRPPDVLAEVVAAGVAAATLIKAGGDELEEVAMLAGCEPSPGGYFTANPRLEWLCITRGAAGAELLHRDGEHWIAEPPEVEVVDTVGAGDTLTAGLIDGLGRGRPPGEAIEEAVKLSTSVVTRRGGLPPPLRPR